jgi:2-hydroxy-3-keto-5-methylthiopentenyl-1-phosphate phosphatase
MTQVQLFLDWDGTLTKHDTILVLSRIGYEVNERNGRKLQPWQDIVQAYLDDLEAHTVSYQPAKEWRRSVQEESKYLTSLKKVEWNSIKRVEKAGIFKGVKAADLEAGAKEALEKGEVEMRPGWEKLLMLDSKTNSQQNNVADLLVVSVNWSGVFIRECLRHATLSQKANTQAIEKISISSNELEDIHCPGSKGSTGSLQGTIHTSADKAKAVEELIVRQKLEGKVDGQEVVSVYIGDTATDFDALLLVDFGICIRDEPLRGGQKELADMFDRVGVNVLSLTEASWPRPLQSQFLQLKNHKTVYWTKDLSEIAAFVSAKFLNA